MIKILISKYIIHNYLNLHKKIQSAKSYDERFVDWIFLVFIFNNKTLFLLFVKTYISYLIIVFSNCLCPIFNKSFTVFTGLNVDNGTSTNKVFQLCIAPFHNPG